MSTMQERGQATSPGPLEQAQEKVREQVEQVRGTAGGFMNDQIDQRSTQLGEQLHELASALRQSGQNLEGDSGAPASRLVGTAAQQAERLGGYLSAADGNRVLHDFERFGRRNPWGAIAIGAALGFVASRFLKASSSRRYSQHYAHTDYRSLGTGPTGAHPTLPAGTSGTTQHGS